MENNQLARLRSTTCKSRFRFQTDCCHACWKYFTVSAGCKQLAWHARNSFSCTTLLPLADCLFAQTVARKTNFFNSQLTAFQSYFIIAVYFQSKHSPRRCLSASERLDMFAVKVGMTELLFAPENVKRKGHTWQDMRRELKDFGKLLLQKTNGICFYSTELEKGKRFWDFERFWEISLK